MTSCDFLLVIPAYNESERLPVFLHQLLPVLADCQHNIQVLVVDDGSTKAHRETEQQVIQKLQSNFLFLNDLMIQQENQGKGAAVRRGWRDGPEAKWYCFVDADGSIKPTEVVRLCNMAVMNDFERDGSLFASRIKMLGRTVERETLRHYWGRVFATLVGQLLNEDVYDSQCGYKLLRSEAWHQIDARLVEDGFAFDVELLVALLASGEVIHEIPIHWSHEAGSKLNLFKDSLMMFSSLLRIHSRRKSGFYEM